jgi:hypothetical protein
LFDRRPKTPFLCCVLRNGAIRRHGPAVPDRALDV